ncbi:lysine-sensitive aspartokinase 3 [Bacteroidetes/Chlorobi group bacterium Naka2016]|jgi:aspartate kinase|nr:MAG: lysine-sensitive aspartokinase 3 [Bacteroidetes/Chlorobi group bacterium Naka2016]
MIVAKFGGTSVANAFAIEQVKNILSKKEKKTFVVVSAFAGVTDLLLRIINLIKNKDKSYHQEIESLFKRHYEVVEQLRLNQNVVDFLDQSKHEFQMVSNALVVLGEITPRSVDLILSYGEILSSQIIYAYLKSQGFDINYVDPRAIIKTDVNFTCAEVDVVATETQIRNYLAGNSAFQFHITGGFVGSTLDGFTTTLGRGGSDYSASIIASVISAEELEIWTDVDGIMTCDPNFVPNAKLLEHVSYKEASEMAIFGAKVLHPKTIYPAIKKKIPVFVKNTFNPEGKCTFISSYNSKEKKAKAIAFRKNVTVINIISSQMLGTYGFLSKVFKIFERFETEVDLVSTSEVSISLTIENLAFLSKIVKALKEFSDVEVIQKCVIVSVIGEGIKNSTKVAKRIFSAIDGVNVLMVSMGASDINFSIVVREKDFEKVVRLLHKEFFEQ